MERIKVSNFRKVKDSWDLNLAPITFFTGKNNSGKSSIIKSLMVLEDYIKSNNHFELNLNGNNALKHKIDSYKNLLNRNNFASFKKNVIFEYFNNGYNIFLEFEPNKHYLKAQLKELKVIREDEATLKIYRTSGVNYQLQIDELLLNEKPFETDKQEDKKRNELINIRNESEYLIKDNLNKIDYLEKVLKDFELKYSDELNNFDKKSKEIKTIIQQKNEQKINIISIKQETEGFQKKLKQLDKIIGNNKPYVSELKYSPDFSLNDFDASSRSIDKIIRTILPKYLVNNNLGNKRIKNDFKNSDESLELDKANKLGDELLLALSFNVKHLSPHRSNQNKLFIHQNRDVDINFLTKNHFEKQLNADVDVQKFMKKWMSNEFFDIGEDYRVVTYESTVSKIEIYEDESWINLAEKGFGAGQIFSVLLAIASSIIENQRKIAEKGALFEEDLSVILIEEPEANLHPKLQSKLAELFLDAHIKFGVNFILETHSEYMIRKSQLLSLENQEHFKLYYFGKEGPYEMEYNNDNGTFSREFEEGFFEVGSSLAFDLAIKNFN